MFSFITNEKPLVKLMSFFIIVSDKPVIYQLKTLFLQVVCSKFYSE